MADLLLMEPAGPQAQIQNYPPEHRYTRWGTVASIGAHVTFIVIVLILAYLNHIKSLRDLMAAQAANPPPPANEIEVVLPPDETPPPPTDHPLFIVQQIQIPKPPPPPIIPPKIKPKPVPHPVVIAKHPPSPSHVVTNRPAAQFVIGSGNLPHPDYPMDCLQNRIQGTVTVTVTFDGAGDVGSVDISSSGNTELDRHTRTFVMENWHDPTLAGQTRTGPVIYTLGN